MEGIETNYPRRCWAGWRGEPSGRAECASGGVATALAEYIIHNGGIVYGAAYNDKFVPEIRRASRLEELEAFKGSKYSQSYLRPETVRQIKKELEDGRIVLFIGLPCQVAAVKKAAGDNDRLYLADILCHGVLPANYLVEELKYLKPGPVTNVRFRGNDSHDYRLSLWNGDECIYERAADKQPYFSAFIWGIGFKEACYSCRYARPERTGDITLGDFIWLGKTVPFDGRPEGNISFISANTEKGERLVSLLETSDNQIQLRERNFSERLQYPTSITQPAKRHPADKKFRKLMLKYDFPVAIRKTLRPVYAKRAIIGFYVALKRKLGINGPLRISRKRRS